MEDDDFLSPFPNFKNPTPKKMPTLEKLNETE